MKICMLVARFPPDVGGTQTQAYHLAKALKMQGIDIEILSQKTEYCNSQHSVYGTISVWRIGRQTGKSWSTLSYMVLALTHIWRSKPDIVHAHMLSSPAVIGAFSSLVWGIPSLAKVSGLGIIGELGVAKKSLLQAAKIAFLKKYLNAVIATTNTMQYELEHAFFSKEKIKVVPNGVDTEKFAPTGMDDKKQLRTVLGLPGDAVIVIYTGRFSKEKGLDTLIESWENIKLCNKCILILLGNGTERKTLQEKSANMNNVLFAGPTENVATYLKAADIFVLPSHEEAMPNSLLEAMSCGLACLVTNVGGVPEIVNDGKEAIVIESKNAQELHKSLSMLVENKLLRELLGTNARRKAECEYSIKTVANRHLKIYEHLRFGGLTCPT